MLTPDMISERDCCTKCADMAYADTANICEALQV